MNRFTQKKTSSRLLHNLAATALVFLLALFLLVHGSSSVSESASASQMESLRQAILRSAVHCYAVEGHYPESLDYLREHYGITWDESRYIVDYEVTGANLRPDVTVFAVARKGGTS
jgi:hypothetical protein